MGAGTLTRKKDARGATRRKSARTPTRKRPARITAEQFRELLDETLFEVDRDETAGPLLRAAGLRMRLRFPDLDLVLCVASSDDPDHHLRWEFSDPAGWEPKLALTMSSDVANAYLQGAESLAVAIARGRARYTGNTRCSLLHVPALRLVSERYRELVRRKHPELIA